MRRLILLVPVVIILPTIPMILGKVPLNSLYGFRTAYTLSSDEVWYRANKVSGIALLMYVGYIALFLLAFALTKRFHPQYRSLYWKCSPKDREQLFQDSGWLRKFFGYPKPPRINKGKPVKNSK